MPEFTSSSSLMESCVDVEAGSLWGGEADLLLVLPEPPNINIKLSSSGDVTAIILILYFS